MGSEETPIDGLDISGTTGGSLEQTASTDGTSEAPAKIEEFEIREVLGKGGFGTVYAAFDTILQRDVAIKIPHQSLVVRSDIAAVYLREARAVASLEHPNIIPIYRAASTDEIPFYIVSKLIRGCHLKAWLEQRVQAIPQVIEILASVADALGVAHSRGIVHRDVKPGNILIDGDCHPYVADFGLALRDADHKSAPSYIGTPAYMSPEQARGEGHRVDGRSDLFSLGSVMYQMLTGVRPFQAADRNGLFEQILYFEPTPPQELRAEISKELARICVKSLAKRKSDRYQSAAAFKLDLNAALQSITKRHADASSNVVPGQSFDLISSDSELITPANVPVVPKGLRSFDLHDADFYLRLLPGPYDRKGIPEIVRFWLNNFGQNEQETPIPVGLIYGPSGCGKTSLVRAGILPRMPTDVTTIYLQASPENTEKELYQRLISMVSESISADQPTPTLPEVFSLLRRSKRRRIVIFIDQFEQWLFTHPECARESLTQALRQCDGQHLQCVLMVRDDFWMGVTRLFQSLDLLVAENVNATSVDLFDMDHARSVLAEFGAAYGRLPTSVSLCTPDQLRFLDEAVRYLASGGRIVSVQLALLVEMLKNHPWDRSTGMLKDGGISIGVHFLNETFDSEKTQRRMRVHAEGAHRVLRALLPEPGSRIKGAICSEVDLAEKAGYRDRQHFRELLTILDRELHLITPTDQLDEESYSSDSPMSESSPAGYQLTHDFLIAPLRQWIELRSRATNQGKARLRLEEFSELYRARPRSQSLPTLLDYLSIRWHTKRQLTNDFQRTMLRAATLMHLRHLAAWAAVLLVLGVGGGMVYRQMEKRNQLANERTALAELLNAEIPQALAYAEALKESEFIVRETNKIVASTETTPKDQFRAALVLVDQDPVAADRVADFALHASPDETVYLATSKRFPYAQTRDVFRSVWGNSTRDRGELLRAACLLANDSAGVDDLRRDEGIKRLLDLLLTEDPVWISQWSRGLELVAKDLLPGLMVFLRSPNRSEEAIGAAHLVASFCQGKPERLASLLPYLNPRELSIVTASLEGAESARQAVFREYQQVLEDQQNQIDIREPWGAPWWCVGDRKPLPVPKQTHFSSDLIYELSNADAIWAEHAMLIHRLPIAKTQEVFAALENEGYRIASLIPYSEESERFVFALAMRDQAASKWKLGMDEAELRETNLQNRENGFLPSVIKCYSNEDKEKHLYSCIWIRPPAGTALEDADMYVNVHHEQHESEGWGLLGEKGMWLPRSSLLAKDSAGQDHLSSVRWKIASKVPFFDKWNVSADTFEAIQSNSRSATLLQANLSHATTEDPSRGQTVIWWEDIPVESHCTGYQPRREQMRLVAKLLETGYYPVTIDATPFDGNQTTQFQTVWWRPQIAMDRQLALQQRQKKLVFALFQLGYREPLLDSLRFDAGDGLRGQVISGVSEMDLPVSWLCDQIHDRFQDLSVRRSCAMALALYPIDRFADDRRRLFEAQVAATYQSIRDSGLRSAIQLIARNWDFLLPESELVLSSEELSSIGDERFVILKKPGKNWLGSPPGEPGRDGVKERQIPVSIDRSFAIATTEVTLAQFREFRPDWSYADSYTPTDDCPVIGVTWYDALKYCRWLSERENFAETQMCYPEEDKIASGMSLPDDYLDRIGYRLPTASEWEYACRGESETGRWFGFNQDILDDHAWTAQNSGYVLHPVANRLPNDFGLFDMLGNGMEWCQTPFEYYPHLSAEPWQDSELATFPDHEVRMETRGGAMLYQPLDARASQRNAHPAGSARVYLTFRIARTVND
ncbi:Serine/threonine-protein kinase PknB [Roseimaritima multifibrata]|uniref:Serine/threonine-protein kinase PknB n=1 Tax=Roseimaritima multifibrata TaxID=1930274 RepID=A0A517MHQ8_9BACT|nr:SUMF1/EgtB/PvdO family nonheme iron enzyme [Roseimaritima multifibrata]QDS94418.1 Serine/threonine-protein kinase PknB [Roseimaritima multifibrata]